MAAGSALAMWIGERITENGIGNGVSLLIMAGIVSNMFNWGRQAVDGMAEGRVNPLAVIVIVIALLAMIVAITFVDRASAASRFSTPSAWWVARCMAVSPPTSR